MEQSQTDEGMNETTFLSKDVSDKENGIGENTDTNIKDGKSPFFFKRGKSSFWDLRFKSPLLESCVGDVFATQQCQRFKYSIYYMITAMILWGIYYFLVHPAYWILYIVFLIMHFIIILFLLLVTFTKTFLKYPNFFCVVFILTLSSFTLIPILIMPISQLTFICSTAKVVVLIYANIHYSILTVFPIALTYSFLSISLAFSVSSTALTLHIFSVWGVLFFSLVHLSVNVIGIHLHYNSNIHFRKSFWKIGQSLVAKKNLDNERNLKEKMIHCVMPPIVAKELLEPQEDENEFNPKKPTRSFHTQNSQQGISTSFTSNVFRPFKMSIMNSVSILFADIVGFTKMSSNKSAEVIVGLLNDLFGRFDALCEKYNCEKVATLGDCYYCVSGCPQPRTDNAICAVKMGLGMCRAIRQFDIDTNENVDMRVGIHTGTVHFGILGIHRFRFDVWSNDVTFANKLETYGKAGRVHISQVTLDCLDNTFDVEEVETCEDLRTYFVVKSKLPEEEDDIYLSAMQDKNEMNTLINTVHLDEKHEAAEKSLLNQHYDSVFNHSQSKSFMNHDFEISNHSSIEKRNEENNKYDQQLVGCFYEELKKDNFRLLSYSSDINFSSLKFNNPVLENHYRLSYLEFNMKSSLLMLSFLLAAISILIYFFATIILQTGIGLCNHKLSITWIVVSSLSFIFFVSFIFRYKIKKTSVRGKKRKINNKLDFSDSISVSSKSSVINYKINVKWYLLNFCLLCVMFLPNYIVLSVYNFDCLRHSSHSTTITWCSMFIVSLLCPLNFFSISYIGKIINLLVSSSLFFFLLLKVHNYHHGFLSLFDQSTKPLPTKITNLSFESLSKEEFIRLEHISYDSVMLLEALTNICLSIFITFFLLREVERVRRVYFCASKNAINDKNRIELYRNSANWLLYNIMPQHVANVLKKTNKYGQNHDCVGVIFASIINFNELYDESYQGGKECLRVLNEIISDFDELLDKPEYMLYIEKIKTIGSTYMATSGLKPHSCNDSKDHLVALMNFCLDMLKVVHAFNNELLGFNFILRIGYNYGPLTSGVIGTRKLYYDIWGDAVNVASRMDSTGVPWKVQVSEAVAQHLMDQFSFEKRGEMEIKGKGRITTYFLKEKL